MKKILIIKTSSLGDIVHALPVLEYIKMAAPEASIDWVVDEAFQDLVNRNKHLNKIFRIPLRQWKKNPISKRTWRGISTFLKNLRAQKYDIIFDLQGNIKSGIICGAALGWRKIGFSFTNLQEAASAIFTTEKIEFTPLDLHATQRYLRVISAAFTLPPNAENFPPHILTDPDDDAFVANLLGKLNSPYILFHTGTSWHSKMWFNEGWIFAGKRLLTLHQNATIILSWGNPEEYYRAKNISDQLSEFNVKLLPKLSLKQFTALLKCCSIVVAPDTGPLHLAAAVGTPTVSIYRCTDGLRNGPLGSKHIMLQAPRDCSACWNGTCRWDIECTRSIAPHLVAEAAHKLLSYANKR